MPGNEYGEKIHNFFEQEGLSQEQHQSQVVDGSWSSFNNGLVSNQRQIDPSLIANLKTYNTQQPVDPGRSQSSNSQHDLNFTEQPIRSEFSRSLLQERQQLTNGYMHRNLGLQTMPNGANLTGVDVESSRDRLSTRGLTPELHKIPMRFEMGESPVNYDFFGGQQQLNTQLPGMLQPLPRQQMTFNDMQLLKQQVMVKQMHEYQMQQQLQKQQLEARQFNSLNSDTVNGSRSSDNQSHPLINGIPLQDASSNCWQPDRMTGNTNWMHHGISPAAQGSSSGLMVTPEHGQTNLLAQQFEPSLYGMPVSGTNAPQNGFSSVQMNRLAAQHGSANRSSSLTNQPTSFINQGGVQDSHMLPRSTYQEKVLFSHTAVPGSNNRPSFENFQQDDSRERNISVQEKFGQMEGSNPSEKSFMKVPENITPLQKSTTLDPTEEKILFGSDDNLWDAFGSSTDMSLTGNLMSSSSDLYDACPSLQSGSWSALMQSAVAETSSDDAGVHGWANDNTGPHVNSHTGIRADDLGVKASNALSERFHNDSTRAAVQHLPGKRNNVLDHGLLEKPMTQVSQMAGNMFHSSSSGIGEQNNLCSIRKNEGIDDRFGIWKAASNPNLAAMIEQKNHFTQNPLMQRTNYGFGIAGAGKDTSASRDVQGNIQQHLDNNSVEKANPQQKSRVGSQILESYASNNAGSNEMVNAHHFSMLPGGKDTQSGHVSSRPSISRKFQYHPMGNIDVTNESCQEKVSYLPPTLEHASVGNQGYFGQSKSHGQPSMNMRIDRNGYMHRNLGLQTMPNGANLTGVDVESSRDRLSTRGLTPELHKIPMRFEMGESPVNYDFFGGQQQLNTQLPGMLQPLPRQQMTFNDMQLLKQQVMVKQMHEYQMQQQLQKQQLEARQFNSLNSDTVNGSRSSDNQSHPLINGIPLQDASSNCWQPDRMTGNTNWMHHGISPAAQGSSSGLMVTPEHGQTNLLAQQFEPSLYGMPVSGTNAPQNGFSSVQMNRLAAQHGSANRSSSLTNQPTSFINQGGVQDSHMLPRSTYQEKVLFSHTAVPGSNNRPSFENFQQDDSRERNISVQEKFGQMEGSNPSEKSFMKVPENITPLQKSTTLDPTEEKILFGSDDNLWDAFGSSTDMSLTGNLMSSSSDLYDACPSLQSGSWSALMQSAVAETSSDDAGVHGWANDNTGPHVNSHTGIRADDLGVKASNALSERFHNDSTRAAVQHLPGKRNNVLDHGLLEKPMTQVSQMAGNMFHSSSSGIGEQNNLCSIRKNEGIDDRFGIWKAASNPNLAAMIEQKNHFTQNPLMQRTNYGFGIAGAGKDTSASRDVQGNIQQHLDNNSVEKANPQQKSRVGSQILESYASNNAGSNEMVNAHHFSMLPGGKDTQSGHVSSRPSISRKFQYHPMGNIDVTNESCQEKVSYLPPTLEHASVGNQGYFGQSKSHGQPSMNMRIDRGPVSQNDLNCTNEAFNGMGSENSPSTSASADRSVDRCNQVKSASSRQTMLELLHKVDQSPGNSSETNVSGIQEANTSAEYGGQFQRSQSSASQEVSLQLAPPSQLAPSPDNVQFSRNSLQPLNTFHTAPEKVGTSQSRFAPWASNQSFPQQSTHQGPFPGILGGSNMTSGFPYSRGYHQNQQTPVATRKSAANYSINSSSELSTPEVKERDERSDFDQRGHSAQTPSLLNPTTHNKKGDSAEGFPMLSASQPLVASSSPQQSSSSGMMSDSPASISAPQHRFWNQPSIKPQPDILRPHPLPSNNIAVTFSRQEKTNQLCSQNGGDVSLSGRDMVNMHELQGKDMGAKQTSDVASMFSKMVQSNHQSFDRSLPSNNLPKDSLRHNEQMAGSGEGDAPKMTVKRVENSAIDPQKVAPRGEQQSPSRSDGLVKDGLNHKESANHITHFGQTVSQSFSTKNQSASAGADQQQISPQMAPSWYNQYGTFKNGLVQPVTDAGRFTPLKIGEQYSNVGSSVDGTHSVQSSKHFIMQQMSGCAPGAQAPSSESLLHSDTDQLLKVDKPKKRKTATSELLSWNKEVMQDPQRLKTLSEAEVNWARATNRFAEKVEFETLLEDGPPIRSKKRLIYTTHLIQQLFSPPPARVISLVASSNYEFVAYTAARAALGDACSSSYNDRSEPFSPPINSNPLSERTKTEKISDQYISKAAEDFISRTRKLETDFTGLENGTTIPDLRVEVQDLEKFAVINRFAKFHPPSSSMDRTVNSLRLNPQRYVTIAPMPQNIPDRVQCLSL